LYYLEAIEDVAGCSADLQQGSAIVELERRRRARRVHCRQSRRRV